MLTPSQQSTILSYIQSDSELNVLTASSDSINFIVNKLNAPIVPDFFVYKTDVNVSDIYDKINWQNFTPVDAPDINLIYQNRALICQLKLDLTNSFLIGRQTINAAKANIRNGLQDALTGIPSGVAGASKSGGWSNVQSVLYRRANIVEKLFSTGLGTTANPGTLDYEGGVFYNDILIIMDW
jgi:hypothetical protein